MSIIENERRSAQPPPEKIARTAMDLVPISEELFRAEGIAPSYELAEGRNICTIELLGIYFPQLKATSLLPRTYRKTQMQSSSTSKSIKDYDHMHHDAKVVTRFTTRNCGKAGQRSRILVFSFLRPGRQERRPPPSQSFLYPNHSSGRRYQPPSWHNSKDDAYLWCDFCGGYFAPCTHNPRSACHFQRIIFVDGACSHNGSKKEIAFAAIGVILGSISTSHFSQPFDSTLYTNLQAPRTNQRAEILAATVGLQRLAAEESLKLDGDWACGRPPPQWIVASDSKYIVDAMTVWMPSWKGRIPANLDLFQALDTWVHFLEERFRVEIRFWWMPRDQIQHAHWLTKAGADISKELQELERIER
ncbi:ribonuclease H-like domain-containing protein [Pterulicium gracile]|uniref:ribonuclease H n=1 Tax=Pterulicium gracile TaxID=1884261 RepID=A0A5C3QAF1_9AGAR|nr:ribonuclease H-like domain-containing protein [Pterula gracilis]